MQNQIARTVGDGFMKLVSQSAAEGALPSLYAATAPDVHNGDYIGPSGVMEIRGAPKKVGRSGAAKDALVAQELWSKSEELTGVTYDFAS